MAMLSCMSPFQETIGGSAMTLQCTVKMAINIICSWARLPVTSEVWGLFSHLIPTEALSRFESGI